jgi:predicted nuclease of predicted toxin-antitoxin system
VKLLIDASLSPRVAVRLGAGGHEATHVVDIGMLRAHDETIFATAGEAGQVIVTADADFGTLLALGAGSGPSVILLRSADQLVPDAQAALVLEVLEQVAADLEEGAIVSLSRGHLRVRNLPMSRGEP